MKERYAGTTGTMLHEFKHAFQYYEGKLGFFVDNLNIPSSNSSNNRILEKEANYRGSVFSFSNTKSWKNYQLNDYLDLEPDIYSSARHVKYATKEGLIYINNGKNYNPFF